MKSSTPTNKKRNTGTKKTVPAKTSKGKTVYIAIAIFFLVFLAAGYVFLREPENQAPADLMKKTEEPSRSDVTTGPVAVLDNRIAVTNATLQAEVVDNKDILKVVVRKTTGESDKEIVYRYEWTINGKPAGNGSDSLSGFKRGDNVTVMITPFDGEAAGKPRKLIVDIQNTTPKVHESREPKYDGKLFTMQINASDPDGDVLSYELLKGPKGMTIDKKSGMINWPVQENGGGEYPVTAKITDGHGGETTYQLTATIPKASP